MFALQFLRENRVSIPLNYKATQLNFTPITWLVAWCINRMCQSDGMKKF